MLGLVLYIILSIVMSTVCTIATCKATNLSELSELSLCSKICFALYFAVANLIAWPMYCIFTASATLHGEGNL